MVVLFFVCLYGLVRFEAEMDLFNPIRNFLTTIPYLGYHFFEKVFSCYFCLGAWNTLLLLGIYYYPVSVTPNLWTVQSVITFMLLIFGGAATSYFFHLLENVLTSFVLVALQISKNTYSNDALKTMLPKSTFHHIINHDSASINDILS